jgi:hypothetical protein
VVTYLAIRPPKLQRSSVLLIGVLLFLVGVLFFLLLIVIIIVLLFRLLVLLGMMKASRPLIRVLVINDNGLWINDFI